MKSIIVVEGKSDTRRLKEIYKDIITVETNGLGIDENIINKLKEYNKKYDLIIFTDPDGPGEKIRKILSENLQNLSHAYLPNDKALSKNMKKIGVEHASEADIKEALENLYIPSEIKGTYSINDLVNWGIYNNKKKRILLCNYLHIAYGNNKKLVEQLNYFLIDEEKIMKALKEIDETSK